jgi:hypothetical protein
MDPGDFLYVHPTENNAQRWSKMKLVPMLKGTTALRTLFPMKARDGSDSVLYKERIDGKGAIQISGANSPASLSQVTMKRQVQDDLAKWEMNNAGDPETQADSRSQAHEFAKILKVSTPLVDPGLPHHQEFRGRQPGETLAAVPALRPHADAGMGKLPRQPRRGEPENSHFSCDRMRRRHRGAPPPGHVQGGQGAGRGRHRGLAGREPKAQALPPVVPSVVGLFAAAILRAHRALLAQCPRRSGLGTDVLQRRRRPRLQDAGRGAALGSAARPGRAVALSAQGDPGRLPDRHRRRRLPGRPRRIPGGGLGQGLPPRRRRLWRVPRPHLDQGMFCVPRRPGQTGIRQRLRPPHRHRPAWPSTATPGPRTSGRGPSGICRRR